jgi:hypothetical protein
VSGIIYGTIKAGTNLLEVSQNQNERKTHERKNDHSPSKRNFYWSGLLPKLFNRILKK